MIRLLICFCICFLSLPSIQAREKSRVRQVVSLSKSKIGKNELNKKWGVAVSRPSSSQGEMTIIHCLGREEEIMHQQKIHGPIFRFNQIILNELNVNSVVSVKKKYLNRICQYGRFSPSVNLLKYLLLKGKEIFVTQADTELVQMMKNGAAEDLVGKGPKLFNDLVFYVRENLPKYKCIQEFLPELDEYFEKYKVMENEPEIYSRPYLLDRKKIKSVFTKLENYSGLYEKCVNLKPDKKK